MRSKALVPFIGVSLVAGLAGCTATDELPAFSEPQSEVDLLPDGGTSNVVESVIGSSTRLIWEDAGGTKFFAAKSAEPDEGYTCLVTFVDTEGVSSCGSLPIQIGRTGGPDYLLTLNLGEGSENWSRSQAICMCTTNSDGDHVVNAVRRLLHRLGIATRNAADIDVYGYQRNAARHQVSVAVQF